MRPDRIRAPKYFFHVTARGNNRQDIFQTDTDKLDYLARLRDIFAAGKIRLLSYALMTNHPHLLVQDIVGGNLPLAMQRLHGGYARAWNRRYGRSGHVFTERYHAEPVGSDEHLVNASCYIHNNAVWAGMVKSAEEYRWSSARAYFGEEVEIPVWTDFILDICDGKERYSDLLDASRELKEDERYPLPGAELVRGLWISGSDSFAREVGSMAERRADRRKHRARPKGFDQDTLWKRVEELTGLDRSEIRGPSRRRETARARALYCALARREGIQVVTLAAELERSNAAIVQLASSVNIEDFS